MTHVYAVVVRLLAVSAASWGTVWLLDLGLSEAEAGANIGAGLIAFAVTVLVALVWAFRDGRRAPGTGSARGSAKPTRSEGAASLAARVAWWVAAAVLLGLVAPLQAQSFAPPLDTALLTVHLQTLTPFYVGLVGVPAGLGLTLGALTRRARA